MDLRASIDTVAGRRVLSLDGSADLASAPVLHDAVSRLLAHRPATSTAIDLDGVQLLDDAALGLLVGAAAHARRAGIEFVVVASPGPIRRRLADTRLDQILTVVETL